MNRAGSQVAEPGRPATRRPPDRCQSAVYAVPNRSGGGPAPRGAVRGGRLDRGWCGRVSGTVLNSERIGRIRETGGGAMEFEPMEGLPEVILVGPDASSASA